MNVATKVKSARTAKGWSQQRLADELGVSQNTISSWERGESTPRAKRLRAIAEKLSVPLHSLVPAAA